MMSAAVLTEAEAIAEPTAVSARRIGVIGDDHCSTEDGSDLPREVFDAFADVDLIIHLGHMGVREVLGRGVLDRLGAVAPVLAVRDYSTGADGEPYVTPADGRRVAGLTRVVDAGGVRIGAVHNLGRPPGPAITTPPGGLPEFDGVAVADTVRRKFGVPVAVVVYAGSHRAAALQADGILFVNPGSPTYPKGPGRAAGTRAVGTVGILHLSADSVGFEVIDLSVFRPTATTPR